MPDILPRELPAATTVSPTSVLIVDNGVTVEKATPSLVTEADVRLIRTAPGDTAPPMAPLAGAGEGQVLTLVAGQLKFTDISNVERGDLDGGDAFVSGDGTGDLDGGIA